MFKLVDLTVEITIGSEQVAYQGEDYGYERYIEDIDFGFFNMRDIETDIDDDNLTTIEEWVAYKIDVDGYEHDYVVKVFKDVIVKGDLIYEDS